MRLVSFVLFCLLVFHAEFLSGQCPVRDTVWKKIVSLQTPSPANSLADLKLLLQYEKEIGNCPEHIDSVYTFLLLSIGVLYYKTADFDHAVQYTRQALQIIQANFYKPDINRGSLAKYYFYLSIYYDSLKMPLQKNEAIDSCISKELKANADFKYTSLVLESNVSDLYERGDYALCADRSTLGESLIHRYFKFSDSMNHIVYFIFYHANALKALKKYTEEEQFLESKKNELIKSRSRDYVGVIYSLFGYLYESRGEYNKAISFFSKAYYSDRLTESKEISAGALTSIGIIYGEKLNQNRLALFYYGKALLYAKSRLLANANVSDSFYILANIANVYVRMEKFDSAFYFFQAAFNIIKPGINERDLTSDIQDYVNANSAENVIKLVLDKGNAFLQLYRLNKRPDALQKALSVYRSADRLLTRIRSQQSETQSKLFWQKDTHILYEHAIEAAYLQNNFNEAFYFFEKSRAVLLNQQLDRQNKTSGENNIKLSQIRRKILQLERERDAADVSSPLYIEIQGKLIELNQDVEHLELTIQKDNPLYSQIISDTAFITIHEVRKKILADHRELLEIFSGDSSVYLLHITQDQVLFYKTSKREFDSTTSFYISFVSNPALLNSRFDQFINTSNRLYQLLFRNKPAPSGRIIISPDGQIFPFEALVISKTNGSPNYFLKDHSVSYTYSARYLLTEFDSHFAGSGKNFLGIAPVNFTSGALFTSLQGSDLSLKEIGSYFDKTLNLTNGMATRNNFQKLYSNYKIIQIYSHASDSSIQSEPVIYFADSSLYLSDLIPENKPSTRLIVLSACETANGKLYQGEGVFGFNRGFAAMGIPASITNLWAVDNKSTYQVTELFYKYLATGLPTDIALQKAKLEFMQLSSKEGRLPYYWAATILAGRSEKIDFDRTFPWKDILIIVSLVGLSYLVYQTARTGGRTKFHKHRIKS